MVIYARYLVQDGSRSILASLGPFVYTGVQSCAYVNGYLSPFFVLSRRVGESGPLSPLLYVLASEVLAVNIRANPRITGLSIPGSWAPLSPISQYSDDAILAVFDTNSRLEAAS